MRRQFDLKAVVLSGLAAGAAFVAVLEANMFANVENVLLYPITRFEDIHPAIRTGQVDRYYTWPAFWQSVPRHIAFGAVCSDQTRTRIFPCSLTFSSKEVGLRFASPGDRESDAETPVCRPRNVAVMRGSAPGAEVGSV